MRQRKFSGIKCEVSGCLKEELWSFESVNCKLNKLLLCKYIHHIILIIAEGIKSVAELYETFLSPTIVKRPLRQQDQGGL